VIVDAHLHVFRPAALWPRPVDALVPAERDAPVEDLLDLMDAHGVDRAVLVPLGPEDDYVAHALRGHPGRFAAVAVAGPAEQGRVDGADPVAALRARREALPFDAVRTMWLGDPAAPLADSPMLPVLRAMAEDRLALWSYVPPDQTGLLEQVPAAVPDLVVVLNHLGFAPHDMRVDEHARPAFDDPLPEPEVRRVLGLARHLQTRLMLSGQYALSGEDAPYRDLDDTVARLADAFGAERMLWASDLPWTRDVPGYAALLDLPRRQLPDATADELSLILGGTALTLFPALRDQQEAR
jgi:L-fuconolactonase